MAAGGPSRCPLYGSGVRMVCVAVLMMTYTISMSNGQIAYTRLEPVVGTEKIVIRRKTIDLRKLSNMDLSHYVMPQGNVSRGRLESFSFVNCSELAENRTCSYRVKYEYGTEGEDAVSLIQLNIDTPYNELFDILVAPQKLTRGNPVCETGSWCLRVPDTESRGKRSGFDCTLKSSTTSNYFLLAVTTKVLSCPDALTISDVDDYVSMQKRSIDASVDKFSTSIDKVLNVVDHLAEQFNSRAEKFEDEASAKFGSFSTRLDEGERELDSYRSSLRDLKALSLANRVWIISQSYYDTVKEALDSYEHQHRLAAAATLCEIGHCAWMMNVLAEMDVKVGALLSGGYDFQPSASTDADTIYITYLQPIDFYQDFINVELQPAMLLGAGCEEVDGGDGGKRYWCSRCFQQDRKKSAGVRASLYMSVNKTTTAPCWMSSLRQSVRFSIPTGCRQVMLNKDSGEFEVRDLEEGCPSKPYMIPSELLMSPLTDVINVTLRRETIEPWAPEYTFNASDYNIDATQIKQAFDKMKGDVRRGYKELRERDRGAREKSDVIRSPLAYHKRIVRIALSLSIANAVLLFCYLVYKVVWPIIKPYAVVLISGLPGDKKRRAMGRGGGHAMGGVVRGGARGGAARGNHLAGQGRGARLGVGQGRGQMPGQARGQMPGQGNRQMPGQARGQIPGHARGQMPGKTRGQMPGLARGQLLGQARGQMPGQARGQMPGLARGQMPGYNGGQMTGQGWIQLPGQARGQMRGQAMGQMPGQARGQMPGLAKGQMSGQTGGQMTGQGLLPMPGQARGQIPGQARGQMPGQARGQMPGQIRGQMPGHAIGQMPGQARGLMPGQTRGQMPGQAMGQMPGQGIGQLPG